ncbi:OapA N-terminal domain-containing protein [Zunongwangia pacifica]
MSKFHRRYLLILSIATLIP